jgi:hypothetical protein
MQVRRAPARAAADVRARPDRGQPARGGGDGDEGGRDEGLRLSRGQADRGHGCEHSLVREGGGMVLGRWCVFHRFNNLNLPQKKNTLFIGNTQFFSLFFFERFTDHRYLSPACLAATERRGRTSCRRRAAA